MPMFAYQAVDGRGKKLSGTVLAVNKYEAINDLTAKGLVLRSLQEKKAGLLQQEITIGRAVKLEHFVIFCRQFATLIRAGVQIDASIGILREQSASKRLKLALSDVEREVQSGHTLSSSMRKHPKIFPDLFVNMIESGETGGNLDDVLDRMAAHYEKEHVIVQKVKSAMTYPIIVLIIAVIVVIFLMVKIVPTFTSMFEEQGAKLPLITRMVISMSDGLARNWSWILLGVVAIGLVTSISVRGEKMRTRLDKLKFAIPIFGPLMRKVVVSRICRTLSELMTSAVPVLQALEVTRKVVGNRHYGRSLQEARAMLEEGKLLSEPFRTSGLFPPMAVRMIAVGEETGQLDKMLGRIADFLDAEVDKSVDQMKALLEPLMLLFVAGVVGVIVVAIMSPMFTLYENFLD